MSPTETRRFHLAHRPEGRPDHDAFELRTVEVEPDPGEALVRTQYLSVDPYMRDRMRAGESYSEPWDVGDPLRGGVVGEVVAGGAGVEPGQTVVGNLPWAEYAVAAGDDLTPVDTGGLPTSAALSVLGMPGRTAYFGTREVAQPRAGDTVVVSGAAGAVGSVVGQLAALQGADVIGVAGSQEKTNWLTDDLGFDGAFDYEHETVPERLDELAPDGVDVYFDNVGGPITDAVFARLNVDARVAVCGQIALYNDEAVPTGPRKLPSLIESRATVEGFLVRDFAPRFREATEHLAELVAAGDLQYRETITEGLANAPDAFLGLFDGDNIGKQLVKVGEE